MRGFFFFLFALLHLCQCAPTVLKVIGDTADNGRVRYFRASTVQVGYAQIDWFDTPFPFVPESVMGSCSLPYSNVVISLTGQGPDFFSHMNVTIVTLSSPPYAKVQTLSLSLPPAVKDLVFVGPLLCSLDGVYAVFSTPPIGAHPRDVVVVFINITSSLSPPPPKSQSSFFSSSVVANVVCSFQPFSGATSSIEFTLDLKRERIVFLVSDYASPKSGQIIVADFSGAGNAAMALATVNMTTIPFTTTYFGYSGPSYCTDNVVAVINHFSAVRGGSNNNGTFSAFLTTFDLSDSCRGVDCDKPVNKTAFFNEDSTWYEAVGAGFDAHSQKYFFLSDHYTLTNLVTYDVVSGQRTVYYLNDVQKPLSLLAMSS